MINKIMKKYGYELIKENEHGVYYERIEPQGFTHVICGVPKSNGNHIMQSYDKELHDIGKTLKINEKHRGMIVKRTWVIGSFVCLTRKKVLLI